jgi:hypothetical protein
VGSTLGEAPTASLLVLVKPTAAQAGSFTSSVGGLEYPLNGNFGRNAQVAVIPRRHPE